MCTPCLWPVLSLVERFLLFVKGKQPQRGGDVDGAQLQGTPLQLVAGAAVRGPALPHFDLQPEYPARARPFNGPRGNAIGWEVAFERFFKQMFTLSPKLDCEECRHLLALLNCPRPYGAVFARLMFIFQAKIIGHYAAWHEHSHRPSMSGIACHQSHHHHQVINEIRYGGATYVSTGRGLPTDRRPFIGEAQPGKSPRCYRLFRKSSLVYSSKTQEDSSNAFSIMVLTGG